MSFKWENRNYLKEKTYYYEQYSSNNLIKLKQKYENINVIRMFTDADRQICIMSLFLFLINRLAK